jgi:hypothetical protein
MAKVITYSRVFPKYHPKAGQPTYFVEKVYKSLFLMKCVPPELATDFNFAVMNDGNYKAKHHTIRNGNRWKVGDKFSPRVWGTDINPKSGRSGPYHSKQIILSEDLEIKQIYQIRIWRESPLNWRIYINGEIISAPKISELAANDGLSHRDLLDWFNVPVEKNFEGQIICWVDSIFY